MSTLIAAGKTLQLDKHGFLHNLEDWTPEVAAVLAAQEGIVLTAAHWEIIELLRSFYAEFQLSPATRPLVKYAAARLGPAKGNSQHLNLLFKGTPAKLAAKLAGLPKPTNCL
jgi:tRNA 2-thiouridine synthesizing protein E